MLGVLLILVSTFLYNGSAVLLAVVARRSGGSSPLLEVGRRSSGLIAVSLNLLGWILEVVALAFIPLTLARLLNVTGLVVLLVLSRLTLKERFGRREVLGVCLIALGIAAASFAPPQIGGTRPGPEAWVLLSLILGPGIFLPYALRFLRLPAGPVVGATAAGLAYALSGILNKGIAYALHPLAALPLAALAAAVAVLGLVGFASELDALKTGRASVVVPVVLALHTVVPIVCAPILFGEAWTAGLLPRALLGGGISLSVAGIFVLAGSPSHAFAEGR